jgi:hypothetical protein
MLVFFYIKKVIFRKLWNNNYFFFYFSLDVLQLIEQDFNLFNFKMPFLIIYYFIVKSSLCLDYYGVNKVYS